GSNGLRGPIGIQAFYRIDDPGVEGAASLPEETRIGDLVREGVLERVLELGKQTRLEQELGSSQLGQAPAEGLAGRVGHPLEQHEGNVLSDAPPGLEESL